MSVESLKSLCDVAAVVMLFLTFAAGFGALLTGNIINARQEEKLRNFESDITAAKSALAIQQERAANAENNLLQLRESLKDRVITPVQEKILIDALRGAPSGKVEVWWTGSDTDSVGLAKQMVEIFRQSGWPPATEHFAAGGTGNGLFIAVHDHTNAPAYAASIQKAYKLIGFEMNGFSKPDVPVGSVQIFIGHKIPPP
jgi:hypothetical protein